MIKGLTYLSAIECLLPEFEFESIGDYTFRLEKGKDEIYRFLLTDKDKQLSQWFTKEQIDAVGLLYVANELENLFNKQ